LASRITALQEHVIRSGHARGLLDHEVAKAAGVSVATVKRYRRKLGLSANCARNRLGRAGEEYFASLARQAGLHVAWPQVRNAPFDVLVNGWRVDVKTARPDRRGWVRLRLPGVRRSFRGRYAYGKAYARDSDVIACVVVPSSEYALHGVVLLPSCDAKGRWLRPEEFRMPDWSLLRDAAAA